MIQYGVIVAQVTSKCMFNVPPLEKFGTSLSRSWYGAKIAKIPTKDILKRPCGL